MRTAHAAPSTTSMPLRSKVPLPVAEMDALRRLRLLIVDSGTSSAGLLRAVNERMPEGRRFTEQALSNWFNGRRKMPEAWMSAAAEVLGVPPEFLLDAPPVAR